MSDDASKELTGPPAPPPLGDVFGGAEQPMDKACALAKETATRILVEFGPTMRRGDRIKILSAFKRRLIPASRSGRRPKETVTAAYRDWKAGMRGVELYRKHIPGWDKHSRWRRRVEQEALRAAIHTRKRRERQRKQRNEASS